MTGRRMPKVMRLAFVFASILLFFGKCWGADKVVSGVWEYHQVSSGFPGTFFSKGGEVKSKSNLRFRMNEGNCKQLQFTFYLVFPDYKVPPGVSPGQYLGRMYVDAGRPLGVDFDAKIVGSFNALELVAVVDLDSDVFVKISSGKSLSVNVGFGGYTFVDGFDITGFAGAIDLLRKDCSMYLASNQKAEKHKARVKIVKDDKKYFDEAVNPRSGLTVKQDKDYF